MNGDYAVSLYSSVCLLIITRTRYESFPTGVVLRVYLIALFIFLETLALCLKLVFRETNETVSLEEGSSRRRKSFACGGEGGGGLRAVSKISFSTRFFSFVALRNYLSSTMAAITGSMRDFSLL
ncbi:hypothetical protein CDAR_592611 [Caerostris darwini]|uniref:Uncharacterized protein n=1 Tax=Caerostris darwini TaxID=1538125 RepID=A0AAV4QGL2_9ARAC|nr:hypothetical protein CDAR_592611 [Caerostris darwini]